MSATDLITWLTDQLDEDYEVARVANALTRSPWTATGLTVSCGDGYPVARADDGEPATATHIARWDPACVLAEVDAKRRIIGRLAETLSTASEYFTVESCDEDDAILAETTMRLLALPYAGRDGYREEWRPA